MRAPIVTQKRARNLRRTLTPPEAMLWLRLRERNGDFTFRRQHAIGPYILDFYCSKLRLAVEVDGAGHDHEVQAEHDRRRDEWLADRGILVQRFPAREVFASPEDVLERVWQVAANRAVANSPPPPASPVPLPLVEGEENQ